ncbi:hypothetical protein [Pseudovibrio sp. Ad26]|uniref:hypothetical protein n=1 Tax=Pseudovibrio sp. Ad26 TaxID=989410 RepID=UPI0007AE4CAA|nr:hypothetical protein [Pseudovibrio sp. Ad26]KZL05060.1 hypothetical protein PsAD26_04635 [Pseudovibrio sp. Ad26]
MTELTITIQVYEDAAHLERLLHSIEDSPLLRNCQVLIVNNSYNQQPRKEVNYIAESSNLISIKCFDASSWAHVRDLVSSRISKPAEYWISKLCLGNPGWSAHHGRMIGMLLTRIFFPEALRTLHLDADIVIPYDLNLKLDELPPFTCFGLSGCPDLSRLEWIEFAALSGLPPTKFNATRYVEKLRCSLKDTEIDAIFDHYTDLCGCLEDNNLPHIKLPTREEFHGATYLLDPKLFVTAPYGEWYDNDWTFFIMNDRTCPSRSFLQESLLHLSRRKKILLTDELQLEEVGKLLHFAALDTGSNTERLRRATIHRQSELERVRLALIEAEGELSQRFGESKSSNLLNAVINLEAAIGQLETESLLMQLDRFSLACVHWPEVLSAADEISITKHDD